MTRVGVIGAYGRMGSATCDAIDADDDLELVARVGRADDLRSLADVGAEVAIEFTEPASVASNVRWCLEKGIHTVVGATGLRDTDLASLGELATERSLGLFVAPNFALGAVLMMRFAAEAAPYFERVEIVERHHEKKLDAPSGTSLRTAALMNEARSEPWTDVPSHEATGVDAGGVRIHSLRLPGSVAHQEVIFGAPGETLTIRHDSLDRSSFMPGVVRAVKRVTELRGLVVGLEHLLDP